MARAAAEPGERLEDAAERSQSPGVPVVAVPDFDRIYRDVAAMVLFSRRNAVGCRIVVDVPDGRGGIGSDCITVPMPVSSDAATEDRIVAFLGGFSTETWVKGRTIAAELDMEYSGGQFSKVMAELVKVKRILESSSAGYRLRSA